MLLHYFQIGDLLYKYEDIEIFHIRTKKKMKDAPHEEMLKKFNDTFRDQRTERRKLENKLFKITSKVS